MDDTFKIYIEQLRDGHIEKIDERLGPSFLEIHEKEVAFADPVHVKGEIYLAEDTLVLHISIATKVILPCVICNDATKVPVEIDDRYLTVSLEEAKGGIYNMKHLLRETILLDTPAFAECNGGRCSHRGEIAQYLRPPTEVNENKLEEGYNPFADFDWDKK